MRHFFHIKGLTAQKYPFGDFSELYNEYFSRIHFYLMRFVADSEQAKDLAADVFVKLWENKEDFVSEEHIRSWLYVAAKNAALTFLHKSKRREALRRQHLHPEEITEAAVEQSMALAELMKVIYDQTTGLSPQSRKVFDLIYCEGKSTREIASILSIAPKTVLNYKLQIVQKLRAALLKKGLITSSTMFVLLEKIFS